LIISRASPAGLCVDVIHLPDNPAQWPSVGRDGLFEVLIHSPGQVRLYPLDAGMQSGNHRARCLSGQEWAELTRRHPPGSTAVGDTDTYTITKQLEWTRRLLVVRGADHYRR
jgi:hypothetical protein